MSSTVAMGALSVIIGGDASALDRMLKGAESSVSSFAKRVSEIAGGVTLANAISKVASSVVDTIQSGLADVQKIAEMAQGAGDTADQMSKLKYAADIAGVSSDTLKSSLSTLSRGLADLAAGSVTPASRALEAMGISAKNTDGTVKTGGQTLTEIADKFASYRDGANKAKLAQDLFGAGGEAMIPLLNKGGSDLQKLGDQAQRYGVVLSGDTQSAVLAFNENLRRMDAIKQGLAMTVAARLLPTLESLSEQLLVLKEDSSFAAQAADGITAAIKFVAGETIYTVAAVRGLSNELKALWEWANAPWGQWGQAWDKVSAAGKETDRVLADLRKHLELAFTGSTSFADRFAGQMDDDMKQASKYVDDFMGTMRQLEISLKKGAPTYNTDNVKNALELFLDSSAKRVAATEAEAATVGKSTAEQAKLKVELEAQAIAKAKDITLTENYRARITEAGDAAAAAAKKLALNQLTQESLMPWEKRNQQLKQYRDLLDGSTGAMQTFSVASLKVQFPNFSSAAFAAQDFQSQIDQLATSAVNNLSSALAQVATGSKSAGEAFKEFATQLLTQLIEMIAKALLFKAVLALLGFSGGGVVDSSQSTSSTGLSLSSTGGLYDSGGYTGSGGKYQPAGIVHRGEVVFSQDDVSRWGGVANVEALRVGGMPRFDAGGAVGSAAVSTSVPQVATAPAATVELRGINARDFYTRDHLATLIDGLNGMFRNGYKLKLA